VIVEGQPLADLAGRIADDGISVGVVVGDPTEDLDADCALFDLVAVTIKGLVDA
jgi:hypothetical protein